MQPVALRVMAQNDVPVTGHSVENGHAEALLASSCCALAALPLTSMPGAGRQVAPCMIAPGPHRAPIQVCVMEWWLLT